MAARKSGAARGKGSAGRNSSTGRSKAKSTRSPSKNRGPGKSYRIVDEYGAITQAQGRGFWIGGTSEGYMGGTNPSFTPPSPGKSYPGGTNRSRPTRTPRSLSSPGTDRFVFPDRPDGTGNRSDQRRIPGPGWPGPGTRVQYKGSAFWQR